MFGEGVGKTVKEKVWMHTSRDIRAVAGQLVKLWMEIFRREKAQGMIKSIRKSVGSSPNVSTVHPIAKVKDAQKYAPGSGKMIPSPSGVSKCRPPNQPASPNGDSPSGGQSKVRIWSRISSFLSLVISKLCTTKMMIWRSVNLVTVNNDGC